MKTLKLSLLAAVGVVLLGLASVAVLPAETTYAAAPPCPDGICEEPGEIAVCTDGDACDGFIQKYIQPFVTLLTISIGILAVISLAVAGIQYSSAGDDPAKVSKAKDRFWQTIIGLVAYLFLFAFLNYLVPGGLI